MVSTGITSQDVPTLYYHGGVPGLAPGKYIEPLRASGAFDLQTLVAEAAQAGAAPATYGNIDHYNTSLVYLTTQRNVAATFASLYRTPTGEPAPGWVYRVEPEGALGTDPDFAAFPDQYATVARARVVAVERRHVIMSSAQQCKAWDCPGTAPDSVDS